MFVWCYYTVSAVLCLPVAVGDLFVEGARPRWWWIVAAVGTAVFPGCLVQSAMLTPYALARKREVARLWRGHWRETLVVAVLSPLAYLFVLFAMRTTPVSVVAPVRELSIVIGGLLAWRVLGEPNPVRRLVGAGIVLSGIVGIAVG
ncbi:EamA family transporter [Streptomyces sp. TS71-3]|uniref:EamA family transporter n=1 Tax=Streptomyces sp. TS71-3 TaxID=2733862 RepID=UPI001B228161|nr:EamA family transporter [Streptomyces sp. TS71-3]GHJ36617.1 hypothetical protein Sm713_22260 [Streptomyces sp. TS71-3]